VILFGIFSMICWGVGGDGLSPVKCLMLVNISYKCSPFP